MPKLQLHINCFFTFFFHFSYLIRTFKAVITSNVSNVQSDSEWTERKAEELMKYIEDFETIKPSTINHG